MATTSREKTPAEIVDGWVHELEKEGGQVRLSPMFKTIADAALFALGPAGLLQVAFMVAHADRDTTEQAIAFLEKEEPAHVFAVAKDSAEKFRQLLKEANRASE